MLITIKTNAQKDLDYFSKNNEKKLERIFELLEDIEKNPFKGIGKPEKLKYDLTGCWSRRIDREHRLVYKVQKNEIIILSCRYHYS